MHRRGAGGPPAPAGIAVTAPTVTAPAAEVEGHKRTQTPQPYTKKTRLLHQLKSTGTQHPPTQLLKQSFPPCLQLSQGKRISTGTKTPGKIQQKTDESAAKTAPPAKGETIAAALKTTGGCEVTLNTLLGFTSGQLPWHHCSQAGRSQVKRSHDRERSRERCKRACDRSRSRRSPQRAGKKRARR